MRTWTAQIEVDYPGAALVVESIESEYDLLRDQINAAVGEAVRYLSDTSWVRVVLYKTTKQGGTRKDRSFSVFRDRRGQVRYQ
jgi:hypothetical protein